MPAALFDSRKICLHQYARRLRWFQFQHDVPRVLKLFRQGQPLSPRVASLQFRYPGVTQKTREWTLPVVWSTWDRAFPLRAVPIVLLGLFDVFISPHFVAAPCHRFFPVSTTVRIARAAHRLQSGNTHTSHSQSLHAWLIVFLELSGHNDASTFHVISPALVRCRGIISYTSYSRTNDYVKLWLRHCVQLYAQQHHA